LALAQAELAKQAVERLPGRPEAIIRITTTTGDRRLDINLSQPGGAKIDKGLFTKELEEALLSGEIDVAVHSLKDLPTELQPELELAATLPRHDPVDVLISKTANSLREIPLSGIVATSSPRRVRQIAVHRTDLHVTGRPRKRTHPNREVSDRGFVEFVSARESRAGETWLPSERRSNGVRGARTVVSDLVELLPGSWPGRDRPGGQGGLARSSKLQWSR
jgi:hypothetical protein